MVDRILAVVDDDPILRSDVEQVISLGLVQPGPDEDEVSFRRRVLDRLIEQELRFHEVDQFGFAEIPIDDVEQQFEAIRAQFPTREQFEQRLAELGLDEQLLRQLVARQVMVLLYVEERLGARVFVDLDDIRTHYDEVYAPGLERAGREVPSLQTVREEIRTLLKELRLNQEIELWTEELRQEADIEDYFELADGELPPVVSESSAGENSGP